MGVCSVPKPPSRSLPIAACAGVAGQLADVVDVVGHGLETDDRPRGLAPIPAGDEHPGVEGRADHGAAVDQPLDLVVAELPLVGNQCPAVIVAGQHGPAEEIERLGKAGVGEMGRVEDHAQLLEFLEQARCHRR